MGAGIAQMTLTPAFRDFFRPMWAMRGLGRGRDCGRGGAARLGSRTAGDGPGVGAVLGVIALALAGRVMPERGPFFDARSDLSTDDVARFGAELDAGQAAVAVLGLGQGQGQGPDADRAVVALAGLGGKTEVHLLTERALRQAAAAPTIASS